MKNTMSKITVLSLFAAALVAMPALSRAQNSNAAPPAAADQTAPAKKHNPPFHGKLASVDTKAMTITVGKLTIQVNADTKIARDGQPVTLADGKVGEPVSGAYKKTDDGKLIATVLHFGAKGEKQPDAGSKQ